METVSVIYRLGYNTGRDDPNTISLVFIILGILVDLENVNVERDKVQLGKY